jgi:hypothetical protein
MSRKSGKSSRKAGEKKPLAGRPQFFSPRQVRVFLIVMALMLFWVLVADTVRCKAACLKRVKTPYPEIACKYQCPWFWEKH